MDSKQLAQGLSLFSPRPKNKKIPQTSPIKVNDRSFFMKDDAKRPFPNNPRNIFSYEGLFQRENAFPLAPDQEKKSSFYFDVMEQKETPSPKRHRTEYYESSFPLKKKE
jgi:hypothetical protein